MAYQVFTKFMWKKAIVKLVSGIYTIQLKDCVMKGSVTVLFFLLFNIVFFYAVIKVEINHNKAK